MGQPQGAKTTAAGRLDGSVGTAVAASHFALGVGWGADATIAVTSGSTVGRGEATITAVVGGGAMAQATATVAFTYPDGAFEAAPFFLTNTTNDNSIDTGRFANTTTTTTVQTWTFSVLPVTTKVYKLRWACIA
jgi:hypothetical protein